MKTEHECVIKAVKKTMLFHALSLTTSLPFPVYLYTLLSPFENDFIPCADFYSPLSIPHCLEHSSGLDSVLLLKL